RAAIVAAGGKVYFSTRATGLEIRGGRVVGVRCEDDLYEGAAVILAAGHSARDVYRMLHAQGIAIEAKPFAMGVRVEHPQALIDSIQYHMPERGEWLPAASYQLVTQVGSAAGRQNGGGASRQGAGSARPGSRPGAGGRNAGRTGQTGGRGQYVGRDQTAGRGVYSFCMCPGGFIVPAMTDGREAVVNGMSPSGRNSVFANSGIVTEVRPEDYAHLVEAHGPLAGLVLQEQFEHAARAAAGPGLKAPAQRLTDFVTGRRSTTLPQTSYNPGTVATEMHRWMPRFISGALRQGFADFGRKMRGFLTEEAIILGVESRTSSPVRIPRDPDTWMHPGTPGLFPSAEGAGYAGGIVSAAIDGERSAEKVAEYLK
ncbi:MAG: hypothetical protein LBU95_03020, partial [Rikenellaceae bacterium]|nr:hypothetical protein [Rikenellaceae bacterium]